MKKTSIIAGASVVTLSALLTLMTTFTPTSAQEGEYSPQGSHHRSEKREEIKDIIENGTYEDFIEIAGDHPMAEKITVENFPLLKELHEAIKNRDFETVKSISEELGFERGVQRAEKAENKEALKAALESGDYDRWRAVLEEVRPESELLEKISADNFPRLLELHELRQEAKEIHEKMKVIEKELKIEHKGKKGHKGGHGFGRRGPANGEANGFAKGGRFGR